MKKTNAAEAAHTAIQALQELPPLPTVAGQLLEEATRDDADLQRLAKLIEHDPGLAARIIGIANSAYFIRQNEVCTVADAIIRVLGLNLVRSLAIGIALSRPFDVSQCPQFDLGRYWYHAMTTATLASRCTPHLHVEQSQLDCLFLAGLLQTLGQFAMAHLFPHDMSKIFEEWKNNAEKPLLDIEKEILDTDEIEAGSIIARKWHLPESIADTIAFRNDPRHSQNFSAVVEIVNFCSRIADYMFDNPDQLPEFIDEKPDALALTDEKFTEMLERMIEHDEQMRAVASSIAGG